MSGNQFRPTPAPLYRQVEEYLARQIYQGELAPGAMLPSDARLGERFGVSRITVRTAVDRLVAANLVRRQRGVGTFVLVPEEGVQTARLLGYVEEIHPVMNFLVLGGNRRPVPADAAASAGLPSGTELQCYLGVNHVGREPLSFLEAFYPDEIARFIGADDFLGKIPPVRLVEMRSGLRFDHAIQTLGAVAACDQVAQALKLEPGQPVIRMKRVYFAQDNKILDISVAHYHPQRFQFEIRIVPHPARTRVAASSSTEAPRAAGAWSPEAFGGRRDAETPK